MRRSIYALAVLLMLLACAVPAGAQGTSRADRFVFIAGPCTLRSGSGAPEGVVTGKICDEWKDVDTGNKYYKLSGTGNTGWIVVLTGTTGAPVNATYITQTTNASLTNEQALAALATGYMKVTTTTGVVTSQAVPIPATDGGTGQTVYAVGDLLYANATTTLAKLADVALNQVLVSGGVGVAPAYSGTPTITGLTTTGVAALTTAAESWVGPSSTTGVYFKTGNVGIGTTAPGRLLSVGATTLAKTAIGQSLIFLGSQMQVGDVHEIGLGGNAGTTNPMSAIGNIVIAGDADAKGALYFATRDVTTDTAPTERMRITNTGNVGIGTTNPSTRLNVVGGRTYLTPTAEPYAIGLSRSEIGNAYYLGVSNNASPHLIFSNNAGTERVRFQDDGNVGIGTTAPVVYANQTSVTINGINYSRVDFKKGDVAQAVIYANDVGLTISKTGSNYVDIETDGTRRVRIDGSGSVSLVGTLVTSAGPGDIILPNATGELRAVNAAGTDTISLLRSDASNRAVVTPSLIQANYVSQTTAWGVTAAGAADFRYLFVDEMHAKSFIADLEQALAGGQIVTKSVAVLVSLTCPAAGATATLTVEDLPGAADMQVFDASDWVVIRTFSRAAQTLTIGDCVGQVSAPDTSGSGTQSWTFTRGSGGSAGTVAAATVMEPGQVVLDYGVSGAGYYEVNAVDGIDAVNSPYAQIVTWATAPVAANRTVRARYGNLLGITGTSGEYGLIAGTYAVTDGAYFRASNSVFELHGITAKWWDGATNVVTIAPNSGAPYLGIGNPAPSTCCTTAGIFIGWTAGNVAALSAYTDANNYLTFDGSKLTWKAANTTLDASGNLTATSATLSGSITASSGAIGGWVITADAMKDAAGVVGMSSVVSPENDIRFWAGDATPASAEFKVTEAGELTATSAILTGAITANTGYIGGASGWVISTGYIKDVAGAVGLSAVVTGGDDIRIWAGDTTPASAEFRLTEAGNLYATSAQITGAVNATSGYFGDGATRVAIEAAGINVGNTGSIRGGQTAYATGTGFFLGYSGGAYKSSIGVAGTGNRMTWDGTDLTVVSSTVSLGSTGIAIATPSTSYSGTYAYKFTPTNIGGAEWGVFAKETNSVTRYLGVLNVGTDYGDVMWTELRAEAVKVGPTTHTALLTLFASGTTGASSISANADTIEFTGAVRIFSAASIGQGAAFDNSYVGSLADDASVSIGTIYGHLVLYTATGYMCSFLLHGNGGATIASDPYSKCAVDSTDGKANVYWDGDELRIQNREGATYTYKAFWTGW